MSSEPLPALLDAKSLREELGVTRAAAEAIMRQVPSVVIPGLRKAYCRRSDVEALLEQHTFAKIGGSRMMRRTTQAARRRVNAPGPARAASLMRDNPTRRP